MRIGANYLGDGKCDFVLWAPKAKEIKLKIMSDNPRYIPMDKDNAGYWKITVDSIFPGARYFYQIDGVNERPDPASFYQPEGIHEASSIVDHKSFTWDDDSFSGIALPEMIIYEIHIGTFTQQGDFYGVIPRIKELVHLGVNTLELMPVAQFPGARNWGYDSVYPFAVQNSYGGCEGLKELVNEAHAHGLSVILDVVYNHLGPEGNYLSEYGPYFSDKYRTIWGRAINFDGAYSPEVRNFFIQNALYWLEHYHIDGLRLSAVHGIYDLSAKHILEELVQNVDAFSQSKKRKYYLIAESDLNDVRIIKQQSQGGYGIDAQWSDDFHHSLHTLITAERTGYYGDFGQIRYLARSFEDGFAYQGEYSNHQQRYHGNSSRDIPAYQFIVFSQNHDQIGNRMKGERLIQLTCFETAKLAAGLVITSPYIPLLFMGEEYAEDSPFLYFANYSDEQLMLNVRESRKQEFASLGWQETPPDPGSEETFKQSILEWEKRTKDKHVVMLSLYKELIQLRKTLPALKKLDKHSIEIKTDEEQNILFWRRWFNRNELFCIMNFNSNQVKTTVEVSEGKWDKIIDSSDQIWMGIGSLLGDSIQNGQELQMNATSFALFQKEVLR